MKEVLTSSSVYVVFFEEKNKTVIEKDRICDWVGNKLLNDIWRMKRDYEVKNDRVGACGRSVCVKIPRPSEVYYGNYMLSVASFA